MNRSRKILTALIALAMVLAMLPVTALAEGSYYVDNTPVVLKPGQTAEIKIYAENAAGHVEWTSEGAVSATGDAYLDNGEATIEVTADALGTGYITVTPVEMNTYDGEVLTDTYTVQVDVVGEDGMVPEGGDEGAAPAEQPEAPAEQPEQPAEQPEAPEEQPAEQPQESGPLTDGNNDYAELTEEERLYTTVDGRDYYIIQFPIWLDEEGNEVWNEAVYNLDRLSGFDLETKNYKEIDVDCFKYKDLLEVYVLMDLETEACEYFTLDNGQGFRQLSYVPVNGKQYIVMDFPADFAIPEGYQMVELAFGGSTVHALQKIPEGGAPAPAEEAPAEEAPAEEAPAEEAPAEETPAEEAPAEEPVEEAVVLPVKSMVVDVRTKVMLKGYETQISPGLESADPSNDIYYIYCLVDGNTQLYSYDSGEGTLQRAPLVVYKEIPTEPETVIVYETVQPVADEPATQPELTGIGWNNMQIQMKVLLIALAVAILLIIILIILFAAMSRRNKKRNRSDKNSRRNSPPPRISDRDALPLDDDEDAFFSYVKTETEELDIEDLK